MTQLGYDLDYLCQSGRCYRMASTEQAPGNVDRNASTQSGFTLSDQGPSFSEFAQAQRFIMQDFRDGERIVTFHHVYVLRPQSCLFIGQCARYVVGFPPDHILRALVIASAQYCGVHVHCTAQAFCHSVGTNDRSSRAVGYWAALKSSQWVNDHGSSQDLLQADRSSKLGDLVVLRVKSVLHCHLGELLPSSPEFYHVAICSHGKACRGHHSQLGIQFRFS